MGRRCYVYPPPGGGTTANIPLGTMTLTPQAPTLSIGGGGAVSGFIPDAGYAYLTTPAGFDADFTVQNLGTTFPTIAPILGVFDDFRARTAGTSLTAGDVPTAGTLTWQNNQSSVSFNPRYRRTNRGGIGPALSVLDNERAGGSGGGPFGRSSRIPLGAEYQQMYLFYAEHWRGSFPANQGGRNCEGNGGGYYKRDWLLEDESFGGAAYDCIVAGFLGDGSPRALASITWAGGVATATTVATIPMVTGAGPNWTGTVQGASPAGYNTSGNVTLTQTGANTFTYVVASNPGAIVTPGTYGIPGAIQNGALPVPSASIVTSFGSNSRANFPGIGLPASTFPAGDAAGISSWDPNGWNSWEVGVVGNAAAPTSAPGIYLNSLWNAVSHQAYSVTDNSQALFSPNAGFSSFNRLQFCGIMQCMGTATVDRADVYLALGPQCLYRFFMTDAPTLAASTTVMPCTITSTSASQATIKPRKGAFASLAGNYLWWSDVNNNISRLGQFSPAPTFDFYISTTGSDSNPGTLGSPWAITAINTKQATYSGKRVGLIAGTYNIQALAASSGSGAGNYVRVTLVTNGSANPASPTYIASSDASGNYSRGAAVITAKVGSVYGNPNGNSGSGSARDGNCMIGWRTQDSGRVPPQVNNIVLDGLVLTGNCNNCIQFGDVGATPPTGIVIKNCEIFDCNGIGTEAGINVSWMTLVLNGGLVQNNYIHDCVGQSAGSADHLSAILYWHPTTGSIIERNTVINAGALFGKTQTASNPDIEGSIVRYNYADMSGFTSGLIAPIQDYANSKTATTKIYGNVAIGPQTLALFQDEGSLPTTSAMQVFGNTVIISGTAGNDKNGIANSCTGPLSQYNNIVTYNTAAGGQTEGYAMVTTGAGLSVLDYNVYCKGSASADKWSTWSTSRTGVAGVTTLAAWKTATGKEANSVTAASALFTNTGTTAQKYQLQSGSPAKNAGRVGGVSGGAVMDAGAWGQATADGVIVGCDFAP